MELIASGSSQGQEVLHWFLSHLAVGLGNLIYLLDCPNILIHSRLLNALPQYLPVLFSYIVLPITQRENIQLTRSARNSSLFGAARQVQRQFVEAMADPSVSPQSSS